MLYERDQKGLYSGARAGIVKDVVGMDQLAEFPRNPDVHIINDGSREPVVMVKEIAMKLHMEDIMQ